jgi:hypothetical protein
MVEAKTHRQRPNSQAIGRWLNRCVGIAAALGGDAPPGLILVEPQARGPPKLVANPAVLFAAGRKV